MSDAIKRMNYFDHQFLRAGDFTDEQAYHLEMRRLHNRNFHSYGVATGLDVTYKAGASAASIAAGMALDAQGNELILVDSVQAVDVTKFPSQQVFVTLTYAETATDPSSDAGATGNTRITEAPVVALVAAPADPTLNVVLARITVGADGTISAIDPGDITTPNHRRLSGATGADISVHSVAISDPAMVSTSWPVLSNVGSQTAQLAGQLNITASAIVGGGITASGDISTSGSLVGQNVIAQNQLIVNGNSSFNAPVTVSPNSYLNQGRLFLSGGGGPGGCSLSHNAHRSADNGTWIFPDPSRNGITIEMDNTPGNNSRFEVYGTLPGTQNWYRRFKLNTDNGDTMVCENGGSLGVGGVSTAEVRIDCFGRMRMRQDPRNAGATAGTWLFQSGADRAFLGLTADATNTIGFYSASTGWGLQMNLSTRNVYCPGTIQGSLNAPSDARLKEDVTPIADPLGKVMALRGVAYTLVDEKDKGRHVGFIAQEMQQVLPELVAESEFTGMLGIDYSKLTAVLVEAIKELKGQLTDVQNQLAALTPAKAKAAKA